jgi:hypothetical protein
MPLQRGPVSRPWMIGKQGHILQLGGEFIFDDDGKTCKYASRMQHTEDRKIFFNTPHSIVNNPN